LVDTETPTENSQIALDPMLPYVETVCIDLPPVPEILPVSCEELLRSNIPDDVLGTSLVISASPTLWT